VRGGRRARATRRVRLRFSSRHQRVKVSLKAWCTLFRRKRDVFGHVKPVFHRYPLRATQFPLDEFIDRPPDRLESRERGRGFKRHLARAFPRSLLVRASRDGTSLMSSRTPQNVSHFAASARRMLGPGPCARVPPRARRSSRSHRSGAPPRAERHVRRSGCVRMVRDAIGSWPWHRHTACGRAPV
jgi:hypothetical protein